jgi:hypothetical protein
VAGTCKCSCKWRGDVRFADDQGIVSSSEDGLQRLMYRLNDNISRFNMKINVQKIKTMVVSRDRGVVVNIRIDGQRVEQVKNSKNILDPLSQRMDTTLLM